MQIDKSKLIRVLVSTKPEVFMHYFCILSKANFSAIEEQSKILSATRFRPVSKFTHSMFQSTHECIS